MPQPQTITIHLPDLLVDAINAKLACGDFSTPSDVIATALYLFLDKQHTYTSAVYRLPKNISASSALYDTPFMLL